MTKKDFAEQMAGASNMTYRIIKGNDVMDGKFGLLFGDKPAFAQPNMIQ
jgi:hypothetical protein